MSGHHVAIDDAAWASPWRRRRVSEKVVLSMGLVVTALLSPPWPGCALVAAVCLGLMLIDARIGARLVGVVVLAPMAFLAMSTIPIVWQNGWLRAGILWAHSLAGTLAVELLATTTPMVDLLTWLRRLRVPDPLLEIASLTYRMLFLLLATTLALGEAQRARLGDAASLRRRARTAGQTIGTILVSTWQRADRLNEGLQGRGFEESLRTLAPTRPRSWRMLATIVASLGGIWAANWAWRAAGGWTP